MSTSARIRDDAIGAIPANPPEGPVHSAGQQLVTMIRALRELKVLADVRR